MDWSKINTANIKAAGNAVIFIAALFLSGAISFPPGTSEATQHAILAWDAWILTTVAGVNGVLHFMPDFTVPAPKAGAVAKALLIGFLAVGALAMIESPMSARAAGADEMKVSRGPVTPPPNVSPSPSSGGVGMTGPLATLASQFAGDAAKATALATSIPGLIDGNGAACWQSGETLGAVMTAHPNLLTGNAMEDLEALRLATAAARQICNNPACGTVFEELATGIKTMNGALPISVNLPTQNIFVDACLHIPTIAMVPAPAPTASPTPAPSATGD